MEESQNINPESANNKEEKTFRTLDVKKKQANASEKKKETKKVAPPVKKKIIKFYFSNPYEYKMYKRKKHEKN